MPATVAEKTASRAFVALPPAGGAVKLPLPPAGCETDHVTLSFAEPQTQLCRSTFCPEYRRTLKGETNTCTVGLQTLIGTVVDFVGSSNEVAFRTTVAAEVKTGDVEVPTLVQVLPVEPTVTST